MDSESDEDRISIRQELKSLTFEELLKLKETIGSKNYNAQVLVSKKSSLNSVSKAPQMFKRSNKNRPREESSKIPPKPVFVTVKKSVQEIEVRDPRFDPLSGDFNKSVFLKNYEFLDPVKQSEKEELQKMSKTESDPEEKARIKSLLQRMENQERSDKLVKKKATQMHELREKNIKLMQEGKAPKFKRKADMKALDLIEQYEKLKEEGKLEKYVKKRNKKKAHSKPFVS